MIIQQYKQYLKYFYIGSILITLLLSYIEQGNILLTMPFWQLCLSAIGLFFCLMLGWAIISWGIDLAQQFNIKFLLLNPKTSILRAIIIPGIIGGIVFMTAQALITLLLPIVLFKESIVTTNNLNLFSKICMLVPLTIFSISTLFGLLLIPSWLANFFNKKNKTNLIITSIVIYVLFSTLLGYGGIIVPCTPTALLKLFLTNTLYGILMNYLLWEKGVEVIMVTTFVSNLGLIVMPMLLKFI